MKIFLYYLTIDDEVFYVGLTKDIQQRRKSHQKTKPRPHVFSVIAEFDNILDANLRERSDVEKFSTYTDFHKWNKSPGGDYLIRFNRKPKGKRKWMTNGSESLPILIEETSNYISLGWIFGRTFSSEHKTNISKAVNHSGERNPMYGREHSSVVRSKQSVKQKQRFQRMPNPRSIPVTINEVTYQSIKHAEIALGIGRKTIKKRFLNS